MGRYREQAPQKSPYITKEGFDNLQDELEKLWKKRRRVVVHLSAAAAEGDRSENAEYIYRKKQLREIDRRIRYLQKRIPVFKVISRAPASRERVYFSAFVTLENEAGETVCYRIVGADEFDAKKNAISIDSPMAKSLLGKSQDDEVQVLTPLGVQHYSIIDINYQGDKRT